MKISSWRYRPFSFRYLPMHSEGPTGRRVRGWQLRQCYWQHSPFSWRISKRKKRNFNTTPWSAWYAFRTIIHVIESRSLQSVPLRLYPIFWTLLHSKSTVFRSMIIGWNKEAIVPLWLIIAYQSIWPNKITYICIGHLLIASDFHVENVEKVKNRIASKLTIE